MGTANKGSALAIEHRQGHFCLPWQYRKGDKSLFSESDWQMALEKMQERGFNINSEAILEAVKAAWLQLNLKQIAAGVKEPEVYVPPDGGDKTE